MPPPLTPPDATPTDNSVRMHIAASDPNFPAKREAAVASIIVAIDVVAAAHGFTKKPQSWAKTGPLGTVSLHLQRSRFGFDAYINLGFQPLSEEQHGIWAQDDFVRLGQFYPVEPAGAEGQDALIYLDIHADTSALNRPMQILNDHALPWLLGHLTDPTAQD